MRNKILPIVLALAFLSSALVLAADGSEAEKDAVVIDNNILTDDYDAPSGQWRYVWNTNTLTLEYASLVGLHDGDTSRHVSAIIYCLRTDLPLTIEVIGESVIEERYSSEWYDYEQYAVYCEGGLILTGPEALHIDCPFYDRGFFVKGDMEIRDIWTDIYTSGAAIRVEGNDSSLTISDNSTVVALKQIEAVCTGGITIKDSTVTLCSYLSFLDIGGRDELISGKLTIDNGKIRRTEGIGDPERSRPIVNCWNYEGPNRYDMAGAVLINASFDTSEENHENLVSTDISQASYVGFFTSTVTLDANGGTCGTPSVDTNDDGKLTLPLPVATRDGYDFGGWYTSPKLGEGDEITSDTFFSEDGTIYAQWRMISVEVLFDVRGGSCDRVAENTNEYGTLDDIPAATRDDYIFAGWYTEIDGGGERVTKNTVFLINDATVYAYWVHDVYVIYFDPTGGDVEVPFEITTDGKLRKIPDATREGYCFAGWYTSADGGDKVTESTVFHDNDTIYAHWVEKYTVTFDPTGGFSSTKTAYTNTEKHVDPMPKANRIGYHFIGWYTSADGGDKVTESTEITSDMTLYAHWVRIYWIHFYANGGICDIISEHTNDQGELDSMPEATRDGYVFMGWFTDEEGGVRVTKYTDIDSHMKLYAHWREGTGDILKDNMLGLELSAGCVVAMLVIIAVAAIFVRK